MENFIEMIEEKWGSKAQEKIEEIRMRTFSEDSDSFSEEDKVISSRKTYRVKSFATELSKELGIEDSDVLRVSSWAILKYYGLSLTGPEKDENQNTQFFSK